MDDGGANDVTETEIQRSISVFLAPNRLIKNIIDFPTKDTRQHPSGMEYLWPPDSWFTAHVFVQDLYPDCLDRNMTDHHIAEQVPGDCITTHEAPKVHHWNI